MSSSRLLFRSKTYLTPIRQLCSRDSVSGNIRRQSSILQFYRSSGLINTNALYLPLASVNDIQKRSYVDLPSKQQVEKFTYKSIAGTIDFINKVQASEGYHNLKQWLWKSYFWSIESFKKHVVQNPKVRSYSNNFKRKIDEARAERTKRE